MASCDAMCPEAEIVFRSRNNLVNQLEATMASSSGPRAKFIADPKRMVKEYSRSAADTHKYNKPELLRPFPALNRTVDYLMDLYSSKDRRETMSPSEFASVFSFVSDRLRAVRQDMTMQNMRGRQSIVLIEKMIPFYVETDGLCKMMKCSSFDSKLHDFQLEECFGRWKEDISMASSSTANPQISACFFFRQLHRNPSLLHELYVFRHRIPEEDFHLIHDIICAFQSNNYYRFFAKFGDLDPLLKHSLSDAVSALRQSAMRTIAIAFKTPVAKIPSRLISNWLGFPPDLKHFDAFLKLFGAVPDDNGSVLIASIKPCDIPFLDCSARQYQ